MGCSLDLKLIPHIFRDTEIYTPHSLHKSPSNHALWAKVFDLHYEKISDTHNAVFDTTVWKSSYDGKVFSKEEMDDWLQNTINQIQPFLNPQAHVLEVGCGNGLIFSLIIKSIKTYTGIDVAKNSLTSIAESILGKSDKEKITLYHLPADAIDSIQGQYDLIIVNSVAQYFSDLNYFFDFIKKCESKLSENGVIFIGDIRSFNLADEFYHDVAHFKFPNDQEKAKQYAKRTKDKESELLYSPSVFESLPKVFPWIKSVVVQNKKSKFQNEMTRFRFDTLLFKNGQNETQTNGRLDISQLSNRLSSNIEKIIHNNKDYKLVYLTPDLFNLIKNEN